MGYKVEALVKFNDSIGIVLDKYPVITYERHGNYLLGLDEYGVFVNCYEYEQPGPTWKAFGGREFDIPMTDGSVIKAFGQWWDGGGKYFSEVIGGAIVPATVQTVEGLRKCYVFHGCRASKKELTDLINSYSGKTYEYWEYECFLTGKCHMWDKDAKNPKNMKE